MRLLVFSWFAVTKLGELYDQRDLTVMMDCELPGNPSPEEFMRLGPLQKVELK